MSHYPEIVVKADGTIWHRDAEGNTYPPELDEPVRYGCAYPDTCPITREHYEWECLPPGSAA